MLIYKLYRDFMPIFSQFEGVLEVAQIANSFSMTEKCHYKVLKYLIRLKLPSLDQGGAFGSKNSKMIVTETQNAVKTPKIAKNPIFQGSFFYNLCEKHQETFGELFFPTKIDNYDTLLPY